MIFPPDGTGQPDALTVTELEISPPLYYEI